VGFLFVREINGRYLKSTYSQWLSVRCTKNSNYPIHLGRIESLVEIRQIVDLS
jgi:hypothetical protein